MEGRGGGGEGEGVLMNFPPLKRWGAGERIYCTSSMTHTP